MVKIRPNKNVILGIAGVKNTQQLSLVCGKNWPSVDRFLKSDGREINMEVLTAILVDAFGFDANDIRELTFGEIFTVEE